MRVGQHTKYEFWELTSPNIKNMFPEYYVITKNTKNFTNPKRYLFLIASNQYNDNYRI